ncbi:RidA family protein [Xanthobacter flavus]|uniref:RidA family protein n=1 Tax=Xanthobacter TaxID=279 RepID=UPI00145F6502|nr:RidA family protein [Xanthobacter sp. SG618]NMN58471.1 enamine deaminase RidA (YjgF/YER057c/UK114 family) [Xanthobacter sp. SG618]
MGKIAERLAQLGIVLPDPAIPSANYVPTRRVGTCLYVAGQVPTRDGQDQFTGKLGDTVSLAEGQAAARLCAINLLAQLSKALDGDLDRVAGVVRLGGFVNAVPEFGDHPKVINGASDLMVEVFGDAGRHVRIAVGSSSLPRNVPVEVEGLFEIHTM